MGVLMGWMDGPVFVQPNQQSTQPRSPHPSKIKINHHRQERRTPFDIHDCGDEILTTLAKEELEKEGQENAGGAKGNGALHVGVGVGGWMK